MACLTGASPDFERVWMFREPRDAPRFHATSRLPWDIVAHEASSAAVDANEQVDVGRGRVVIPFDGDVVAQILELDDGLTSRRHPVGSAALT